MLRAVLFDLDDTLFDHRASARAGLVHWREAHGLDAHPLETLEAVYSEILEALHQRLLAGELSLEATREARTTGFFGRFEQVVGPEEAHARYIAYRAAYDDARTTLPGAEALLEALRERGLRLGIVTNNLVVEQTEKLEFLGLRPYFDVVVISEAAGVAKPDPRIFHHALAALEAGPDEVVMVGNSLESDVEGAERVGIRAVWLDRDRTGAEGPAGRAVLHDLEPRDAALSAIVGDGR